ncbi:hypothetical protein BofuT4_uP144490.1 [Botrytis cinerea T4]|uniref:Uncharacterized protein n=1 Tax=Botryotinia fuckeliana (strain T4) TaxID=999810 RepID=G2YYE3_BOTF4|nr:hypothetical protein BofuT4_uP144490.1 [Botrytis cinerea T4]
MSISLDSAILVQLLCMLNHHGTKSISFLTTPFLREHLCINFAIVNSDSVMQGDDSKTIEIQLSHGVHSLD